MQPARRLRLGEPALFECALSEPAGQRCRRWVHGLAGLVLVAGWSVIGAAERPVLPGVVTPAAHLLGQAGSEATMTSSVADPAARGFSEAGWDGRRSLHEADLQTATGHAAQPPAMMWASLTDVGRAEPTPVAEFDPLASLAAAVAVLVLVAWRRRHRRLR